MLNLGWGAFWVASCDVSNARPNFSGSVKLHRVIAFIEQRLQLVADDLDFNCDVCAMRGNTLVTRLNHNLKTPQRSNIKIYSIVSEIYMRQY